MKTILRKAKALLEESTILLRSVPSVLVALFVASVIGMNLLANKSIDTGLDWLALDCGIILSWLSFMTMDIITKRFGPKASILISVLALLINLLACLIFFLASLIPGVWGESFVDGSEAIINKALNNTFGGNWFVLFGSSVAFIVSAVVNSILNWLIGKGFKKNPDGFLAFTMRAYVSTMIGQFVDNLLFALIVSHTLFGWSLTQCFTCAATGAIAELLMEVLFSPIGYKVCRHYEKNGVGQAYIDYRAQMEAGQ